MSGAPGRVVPVPTAETAEFWDACRRHELVLQRCHGCGQVQFYPRVLCGGCGGRELGWVRASGCGVVRSFSIVRRPVSPAYASDGPYALLLVELEEGPTMMSTLTGCEPERAFVGMPVTITFDEWPEGVTMPRFRPA
jgi:uncharacterized OB-fold protein